MSASLTEAQTCIFVRSLAIRKMLGVLSEHHRLADVDAAGNDRPLDGRGDRAVVEVGLGHVARGLGLIMVFSPTRTLATATL